MEIAKRNLELCKRDVEKSQNEYRKAEVDYVLDSLLTWNRSGKLESKDIDLYLTHCINCLHGNIDGTVLVMEKEDKDEKND